MVTPLLYDTYIAVINNSVGAKMFRNLYASVNGKKEDITRNGNLSCAVFLSSILFLFKLIKEPHATVASTVKDLEASGWKQIDKPRVGSILVWSEKKFGKLRCHKHIGFYIGKNKAVSNSDKLRCPVKHDWQFNGKRKVELILWRDFT
jgi:hypothetical protein